MSDTGLPWWASVLRDFMTGLMTRQDLAAAGGEGKMLTGSVGIEGTGYNAAIEEQEKRAHIVAFMRSQLGKKYRLGAEVLPGHEALAEEWDCSESTEAAYRLAGVPIPDGAQAQYDFCRPVSFPKPGDLGFLWSDKRGMIGHVMCYAGHGTVIHAVGGRGVVEDPMSNWDHHARWKGWRRHPDFSRPPEDRA